MHGIVTKRSLKALKGLQTFAFCLELTLKLVVKVILTYSYSV